MIMKHFYTLLCTAFALLFAPSLKGGAPVSATLMTTRGKLLISENFDKPLPPFTGKPIGFASGFEGWRYNAGPASGKSGMWKLADACFTGIENPEAHHPATASCGLKFQNVVIQCDVRLNEVPAEGRLYRTFFVKATDEKDYVCALFGGTSGINALAYDNEHADPKTKQRAKLPASTLSAPTKLGEWRTVVLEILGDELVASTEGKSVTIKSPLIGVTKHSIMLGAGTEASFRYLRVWEALPNPDWQKNKAALLSKQGPANKP